MLLKIQLCLYILIQSNESLVMRLGEMVHCPYSGDYFTKEDYYFASRLQQSLEGK